MKKIVLSAAFVAAMILGTANVYAQTPTKKVAKTEQTTTAKKKTADKKESKKECSKKAKTTTPTTATPTTATPAAKVEKKATKK